MRRRRPISEFIRRRSGRPAALLLLLACAGTPASDGAAPAETAEAADRSRRSAARGQGDGPEPVECFALAWDVAGSVFRPEGIDVDTLPGQLELLAGRPRVIRRPGAAYPVTHEMREWLLDADRDIDARPPALGPVFFGAARDTAALRDFLDRHGQTLPAYRDLKVDGRGRLWVGAGTIFGYDVFDADGRWLGRSQPPIPPDWFVDDLAIGRDPNGIAVYRLLDPDTAIGPHGEPAWRWTRFAACFDLRPEGDEPARHRSADPPLPQRVNLLRTQLWPHLVRFALEPAAPGFRPYWTYRGQAGARLVWEGDGRRLSIELPLDSGGPGHARWWIPSGPSPRIPITAEKVTCGST